MNTNVSNTASTRDLDHFDVLPEVIMMELFLGELSGSTEPEPVGEALASLRQIMYRCLNVLENYSDHITSFPAGSHSAPKHILALVSDMLHGHSDLLYINEQITAYCLSRTRDGKHWEFLGDKGLATSAINTTYMPSAVKRITDWLRMSETYRPVDKDMLGSWLAEDRNDKSAKNTDHLYVISINGKRKIGRSKDTTRRLRTLETTSGDMRNEWVVYDGYGWLEREAHDTFREFRGVGEYFSASFSDITAWVDVRIQKAQADGLLYTN